MTDAELLRFPKEGHAARALVINRRAGGCSSLLRGLDEVGFKVVENSNPTVQPAEGAHIVVVAVSGVDDDACSVVERLRRDSTEKLPILVISDSFDPSVAEEYLELGATDFLSQPSSGRVLRGWCERVLNALQSEWLYEEYVRERRRSGAFDRVIVPLSLALFAERDYGKLLETILLEAKELCLADGGTLYIRTPDDTLEFAMVHNDTLGISVGGAKGPATTFARIPLFRAADGGPEHRFIAAHVAHSGESVALPDLYDATDFDVSGSREFDARHGYRTRSVLAAPLKNESGRVIGVLQLINARDSLSGEAVAFDPHHRQAIESLARLAAAGLEAYGRMQQLRDQIHALHLEIDETKKREQVAQITDSDYFKDLKEKARNLRAKSQRA